MLFSPVKKFLTQGVFVKLSEDDELIRVPEVVVEDRE